MNDKKDHPVEYVMSIYFNTDGVRVDFTGETVKFNPIEGMEMPVRPRHLRIVSEVHNLMRQYVRDNK